MGVCHLDENPWKIPWELHEWLFFSMENVGTVNIPYMDAMGYIKFLAFGLSLKKNVGIHYPTYIFPYEQSQIIRFCVLDIKSNLLMSAWRDSIFDH